MNITTMKIKRAIRINHQDYFDFFDKNQFSQAEEALNAVQNNRYKIVCHHCDISDFGDLNNRIKKEDFKLYPLQGLEYDALIVIDSKYYLIKLEK
ncbi:hypothetical protein MZM54_04815 [[Brevibacterium] frigoritolerans]|nr:hypothetical protein [Peribacillus frigoritolerans]